MPTKTIESTMIVSYADFGEIMDDGWDEVAEVPEFEKAITYRRYDFDEDNMTGDIDKDSYEDYQIYAEIQPFEMEDKQVKSGKLKIGDANIFFPARINIDIHGSAIEEFRPQKYDEVIWKGVSYKIDKIIFERIGRLEIFADCIGKKLSSANPEVTWNDNYEKAFISDSKPGRGWS